MQAAAPPEQLQQSKDEMESACTPRAGGEVDTGVDGWNSSTIHEQTERAASADELIMLYTQWGAATYDEEMDAHDLASYKSVTAKALEFWAADATSGDVRVLDAGCGTGILGAYFRKHTAIPGLHLSGLDLVPALLERAEAKGSYQFLTPGSLLEDLPFPADHFDQIVSSGVFMPGHVGAEAITNIMRVLKPAGMFITTVRESIYKADKVKFDKVIESSNSELLQDELMAYYGEISANVLVIRKK